MNPAFGEKTVALRTFRADQVAIDVLRNVEPSRILVVIPRILPVRAVPETAELPLAHAAAM